MPGQRGSPPTPCLPQTPRGRCCGSDGSAVSSRAAPRAGVCLPGLRLVCVWPLGSVTNVPIATARRFLAWGPEEGRKPLEMAHVAALFRGGQHFQKGAVSIRCSRLLGGALGTERERAGGLLSPPSSLPAPAGGRAGTWGVGKQAGAGGPFWRRRIPCGNDQAGPRCPHSGDGLLQHLLEPPRCSLCCCALSAPCSGVRAGVSSLGRRTGEGIQGDRAAQELQGQGRGLRGSS